MDTFPCRQCGKPVLLIRSDVGNLLCLDAEPSPKGSVRILAGVAFSHTPLWLEPYLPDAGWHTHHNDTCTKRPKALQQPGSDCP